MVDETPNPLSEAPQDKRHIAEDMIGIAGVSSAPPKTARTGAPDQDDEEDAPYKKTRLYIIIRGIWDRADIADSVYGQLIQYANPEMARKTKKGFELQLRTGTKIQWQQEETPEGETFESVTADKTEAFQQSDADAMVLLASARGINPMYFQGTEENKEMLWLAVQKQNLAIRAEFDTIIESMGLTDEQAKDFPVPQLQVANFAPAPDSKVALQWQQEEEAYTAKRAAARAAKPAAAPAESKEAPAVTSKFIDQTPAAAEAPAAKTELSVPEGYEKVDGYLRKKRAHKEKPEAPKEAAAETAKTKTKTPSAKKDFTHAGRRKKKPHYTKKNPHPSYRQHGPKNHK